MGQPARVVGIQYLRGIAAVFVMLSHVTFYVPYAPFKFPMGGAGVDVFFVISGFIMWHTSRHLRPTAFLLRRLLRIAPLYWLVTLFVALTSLNGGIAFGLSVPIEDLLRSLLFLPYFDEGRQSVAPVLGVGWTINIEMYFYFVFAVGLLFRFPLMITVVALLAVPPVAVLAGAADRITLFYAQPRILEFVAGMLLALLYDRGLRQSAQWQYSGILLVGFGLMLCPLPNDIRLGARMVGAVLTVGGILMAEPGLSISRHRFLELLGDASYSLYLTHVVVLALLVGVLWKTRMLLHHPGLTLPLAAAMCVGVGIGVYWLVERPVVSFCQRRLLQRPKGTSMQGGT